MIDVLRRGLQPFFQRAAPPLACAGHFRRRGSSPSSSSEPIGEVVEEELEVA
jgi:hypothetical protein